VISTDLSHYHDLVTARRLDAGTVASIEAGDWRSIEPDRACGATPVRAALLLAGERQQHAIALDVRTSGDTAGPDDRVVGYASFVVR
jgi:AmmeMemoRadiSam system protein B